MTIQHRDKDNKDLVSSEPTSNMKQNFETLEQNTIAQQHKKFRKFIRCAIKDEIISQWDNPYKDKFRIICAQFVSFAKRFKRLGIAMERANR